MAIKIFSGWTDATLEYTFPSSSKGVGWGGGFEALTEEHSFRLDIKKKKFSSGGFSTGDRLLDSRQIDIIGIVEAPTRIEAAMEINNMRNACYRGNHNWQNALLQITQYSQAPYNNLYRIAGVSRFIVDWVSDRAAEVAITFSLIDPFRYDRTEATIPSSGMAQLIFNSGNDYSRTWTFNIPNDLAYTQLPRLLVIKYVGGMKSLVYRNLSARRPSWTTTGMYLSGLQMTTTLAAEQRNLLIDSENATVDLCVADADGANIRDKVDWIKKMASGDFPWLQPGENVLQFVAKPMTTGGGIGLRFYIFYRRRYL